MLVRIVGNILSFLGLLLGLELAKLSPAAIETRLSRKICSRVFFLPVALRFRGHEVRSHTCGDQPKQGANLMPSLALAPLVSTGQAASPPYPVGAGRDVSDRGVTVEVGQHEAVTIKRVPEMSTGQYYQYLMLCAAFIGATIFFWQWWLRFDHVGNWVLFGIRTWVMVYLGTILPVFYLICLGAMKKPVPLSALVGKKVALMTLTVPGAESLEIVERQLVAMSKVRYPHESWLLVDKVHSPAILALATRYGVHYFARHDGATWGAALVERWNQPGPPFQAKTKAGNVNACLEAWRLLGKDYEFFVQFDIDHAPVVAYLDSVLGFFQDESIAWVQSPSVIKNYREHWTARGSLEQEYILQGVLQRGFYGLTDTPMIIGSHCAYRLSAIEQIGGFQTTRAEDHLDTLYLAANGWKGVYLPEILAWGDGPEDFSTYKQQQFAWAFSMFQVLEGHTGKMFGKLALLQTMQFLFVQTWYVLWSSSMLALFLLPVLSLIFNTPTSYVTFSEFMVHFLAQAGVAAATWWWSQKWFLPSRLPILTWRGIILQIARWLVVLSAIIQAALHVKKPYMITVKGMGHRTRSFGTVFYVPYFMLIIIGLGSVQLFLFRVGQSAVQGELLYTLLGVLMVLFVYVVVLLKDVKGLVSDVGIVKALWWRFLPLLILFLMLFSLIGTTYVAYPLIKEAVAYGGVHHVSYLRH